MPLVNTTRRPAAFTLIELLVVIAIIALLMGILLPAFGRARDLSRSTATQARVADLQGACEAFKQDLGAYPGLNRWTLGGQPNMHMLTALQKHWLTGSQMMAMCLLDYHVPGPDKHWEPMADYLAGTNPPDDDRPSRHYLDASRSLTDDRDGQLTGGKAYTVLDTFPEQMPILYFVARPGRVGLSNIYEAADNVDQGRRYPLPTDPDDNRNLVYEFRRMITRSSPSAVNTGTDFSDPAIRPYRQDSFILIAPGIDRKWFTSDDIVNFTR